MSPVAKDLGEQAALLFPLIVSENGERREESPRAFEVFGQLLKNMTDAQEKLMDLHQKKNRLKSDSERQEVTKAQNVTNALFVGSTADLLKLVKKEVKQDG